MWKFKWNGISRDDQNEKQVYKWFTEVSMMFSLDGVKKLMCYYVKCLEKQGTKLKILGTNLIIFCWNKSSNLSFEFKVWVLRNQGLRSPPSSSSNKKYGTY